MKKFLSLLCMITCIFGLTACGSSEEPTAYEQEKMNTAITIATQYVIPSFENFRDPASAEMFSEYTAEEVTYLILENVGFNADGYAYMTGIESFNSAYETIGNLVSIGEANAEIDGDQIIVRVEVQGEADKAEAEIVFTNDMFMKVESAALNPEATMGDLMAKAAMNTLIGMGTVFVVLILISFIISCFGVIPKIQAKLSNKNEKEAKTTGSEEPVAQIVPQEETVDYSDDYELVAVIAAAIAAYEGSASTDGFVVRSIRKVRR